MLPHGKKLFLQTLQHKLLTDSRPLRVLTVALLDSSFGRWRWEGGEIEAKLVVSASTEVKLFQIQNLPVIIDNNPAPTGLRYLLLAWVVHTPTSSRLQ